MRRPSTPRKIGPIVRSPMYRSNARPVRGAMGMVTCLPPSRTLAHDRQRPMPALGRQILDVSVQRLGDPQPVQRKARDQRAVAQTTETGLHE